MSSDTEEKQETPTSDVPVDETSVDTESADQEGSESEGDQPATGETPSESSAGDVAVDSPEFQEMAAGTDGGPVAELNRFQDIKVNVSADLGRAEVSIQTLMSLGEGSILELNRSIDSPVELVAQGVPLACGEVVVINGCFAIRVTEVYQNQKG